MNSFVEKPMAVDGPGLRKFIQACEDAKAKNLSLVNGFCWRYDEPRRETMKQVFDGKIGKVVAIETTYNSRAFGTLGRRATSAVRRWSTSCATGITIAGSPAITSSSRPSTASTR